MAIHMLYCSTAFRIKNPRNHAHRRFHSVIGGPGNKRLPHAVFSLPFGGRVLRVEPLERPFCHATNGHRFSGNWVPVSMTRWPETGARFPA